MSSAYNSQSSLNAAYVRMLPKFKNSITRLATVYDLRILNLHELVPYLFEPRTDDGDTVIAEQKHFWLILNRLFDLLVDNTLIFRDNRARCH